MAAKIEIKANQLMAKVPQHNAFYRDHYHQILKGLIVFLSATLLMVGILLYQVLNKPLPQFYAVTLTGNKMPLVPFTEPNLLTETIVNWASKAATTAYTFDFVNFNQQIAAAKPFFTNNGWADYQQSVSNLLRTIVQNQLFVKSIVSGPPFITNQGPLPGKGYVWRIQIPFLVTYESANSTVNQNFIVVLSIVRVPTSVNLAGIGIDQFVMV